MCAEEYPKRTFFVLRENQCSFASTEEGNILTEEPQWEKIALVKEIEEEVWG